jgi:hypothetical protein
VSQIWKLICQQWICEQCEELSAFQLVAFLLAALPPLLFETYKLRVNVSQKGLKYFQKEVLITATRFD